MQRKINITEDDGENEPVEADTPAETRDGSQDRVAELTRELAASQERYLRALADLDNYRKRYDRELTRQREQERETLIKDLLPIADSLERAATAENASNSPWFEGLMAVRRQLDNFLRNYGIDRINVTRGEHFNPVWHEAITTLALPDTPEGVILDVVEPGYKLGDRVLRPARVIVASGQG